MAMIENSHKEPGNDVDDVRAARAAVSREAGGLEGLGGYLRSVQEEYRTRSGRFAGVPTERSAKTQQTIDSVEADETALDDVRRVREKLSEETGDDTDRLADRAHEIAEQLSDRLGLKPVHRES